MYNGVGLKTARGSGTNGYVQKNLSALSNGRERSLRDRRDDRDWSDAPSRKPDAGILEHERKRKVELQCLELQVELEDKGLSEEDIERQVSDLRTSLLRNLSVAPTRAEAKQLRPSDVHKLQAAKEVESSKFQRALGVSADYREGDAFNPEVQERRKLERIEERKRRDEERVRVAAEREAAYKAARAAREKEEQDRRDFQNELDRKRSRDDPKSPPDRIS
ncbi:cwf21-domain-containing protein [Ceraceosorus guamensis]|uniref:Cwf21-domain-containing protein n=1 Tax=Ceraceosorus guamensis TaxID=1522189 RepID=A0A316VZB3_9BASI|nr:cwf21-domain-containing protein [Ceraceosorus guamensis]PWN42248.1 cwf21-domain-containing protein [Ceraceosorus guamensis]